MKIRFFYKDIRSQLGCDYCICYVQICYELYLSRYEYYNLRINICGESYEIYFICYIRFIWAPFPSLILLFS